MQQIMAINQVGSYSCQHQAYGKQNGGNTDRVTHHLCFARLITLCGMISNIAEHTAAYTKIEKLHAYNYGIDEHPYTKLGSAQFMNKKGCTAKK